MINKVLIDDFEKLRCDSNVNWRFFLNASFLVTGATGLIGSYMVRALSYISKVDNLNLRIICVVRSIEKAQKVFAECLDDVVLVNSNVEDLFDVESDVDYIIHAASQTASKGFVNSPVETINTSVIGTRNLLELAKEKSVKGFVYLSTMEVYGERAQGEVIFEKDVAGFNPETPRNSYPISKQLCEALCCSYYSEYNVPTIVLRLTQTFGPGVDYNDSRVFAEFIRCAIEKKNIILRTPGLTERPYLYSLDAVSAILISLQSGTLGKCYTVANPDTYCSIKEMARIVAEDICNNSIKVCFDYSDNLKYGYANTLYLNLDISRISELGWSPKVGLNEMFMNSINYIMCARRT